MCDHIFSTGLDLTCSSSWGLNFDDFPFFLDPLLHFQKPSYVQFQIDQELRNLCAEDDECVDDDFDDQDDDDDDDEDDDDDDDDEEEEEDDKLVAGMLAHWISPNQP